MDQAHFIHVFVAGVAPVGEGGQGVAGVGGGTPVTTPAFSEGFVARVRRRYPGREHPHEFCTLYRAG